MLILPSKKYRPKGLEELDKECSALGYAMQAGQPELVKAVSTSHIPAFALAYQGSRLVQSNSQNCAEHHHVLQTRLHKLQVLPAHLPQSICDMPQWVW